MRTLTIITSLFILSFSILLASDHIDGPATSKHAIADITDLYAFSKKPGRLNLALNVYPFVLPKGHFSSKVYYEFILRPFLPPKKNQTNHFKYTQEVIITCKAYTPHNHQAHSLTCRSTTGLTSQGIFNDWNNKSRINKDFLLFHGRIADTLFMNTVWAKKLVKDLVVPKPTKSNNLNFLNVLNISLELDIIKLFKRKIDTPIAISAHSYTLRGGKKVILDRVGRPEITNLSLIKYGKADLRDQYNKEHTYIVHPRNPRYVQYKNRLNLKIQEFDSIDSKVDWPFYKRQQLSTLLLQDFLILNPSKPCRHNSFFHIEKHILAGKKHHFCGGRRLEDDIVDDLASVFIGSSVFDGVTQMAKKATLTFPYVREPFVGFLARQKAKLAKKLGF